MRTNKEIYLKVMLTPELKMEIKTRSEKLGLTMSGYLQYLAVKDVASTEQAAEIFIIENVEELIRGLMKVKLKKRLTLLKPSELAVQQYPYTSLGSDTSG